MILAIDSSIGSGVAIVDAETDEVRGHASSETPRGHAEVIGTLIEQALAEAKATPADITHVAAGMGPGPFTGLRIGIAAARAFALGRGIPVVPVASHDAAALAVLEKDPSARFVVITDARRRENAVSAYAGVDGDLPNRIAGPELLPHADDAAAWFAERLEIARPSHLNAEISHISPNSETLGNPHSGSARAHAQTNLTTRIPAENIARLAARMIRQGTIAELEPLYLRAPDARPPGAVKRVST